MTCDSDRWDRVECQGASGEDCYPDVDEAIEIGDRLYCPEHAVCSACGVNDENSSLRLCDGELYCDPCWGDDENETTNRGGMK